VTEHEIDDEPSMSIVYAADGSVEFKSTTTRKGNTRHEERMRKGMNGPMTDSGDSVVDDKGNTISSTFAGPDGKTLGGSTITYEYDSNGNWIKRVSHRSFVKDGKTEEQPGTVTYRTITYY
jgi:hypothetical protein